MTADEIIDDYNNIEYDADGNWYKLKTIFPWCFKITETEDAENIVALDAGGPQGASGGHFKINDDKLYQKDFVTKEWIPLNTIRIVPGEKQTTQGIVAVGEPIKIDGEVNATNIKSIIGFLQKIKPLVGDNLIEDYYDAYDKLTLMLKNAVEENTIEENVLK